jgi:hypothetical protein
VQAPAAPDNLAASQPRRDNIHGKRAVVIMTKRIQATKRDMLKLSSITTFLAALSACSDNEKTVLDGVPYKKGEINTIGYLPLIFPEKIPDSSPDLNVDQIRQ